MEPKQIEQQSAIAKPTYFKTPWGQTYIEAQVEKVDSTGNNLLLCVDVSGSMGGAPIQSVCAVLRDIYKRTKIDYPLFCYNTTVTKKSTKDIENVDLVAGGGTDFPVVFDAIKTHLIANPKSTTFIFMTDGQDGSSAAERQRSTEALKLVVSGLSHLSITVHVIGFGDVNNAFLEGVRKLGTKEGLFKYSTKSSDLQNDFNDMFEYAASAREFSLNIGVNSYSAQSNDDTVCFLINDTIDSDADAYLASGEGSKKIDLVPLEPVRPIHLVKALNLRSPDNEKMVRDIIATANGIVPSGKDLMERLEVEQIKKEINDRMMEYIGLFTQIKMGQVPERVKLQLSALRHDAAFSNLKRKEKLSLRVNKNAEYFKKTDISGILEGYRRDMDIAGWEELKQIRDQWTCAFAHEDLYEMMRKSPDNVMCIGILVKRNDASLDSKVELLDVSNTIISYDSFISAITHMKNNPQADGADADYCIVGAAREKINAVIPLYIHHEHMKRIRILEGIWLGYLFTLDSYGYDKSQEIGLVRLVYDIIKRRTKTEINTRVIKELEKVCKFIITESVGFKSEFGEQTCNNFIHGIHGRSVAQVRDLELMMMLGHLSGNIEDMAKAVYYEHLRREVQTKYNGKDNQELIKFLLYGRENTAIQVAAADVNTANQDDADYVEKSYIEYYNDELRKPIPLIQETVTKARRSIVDADAAHIKANYMVPVPAIITEMLEYAGVDPQSLVSLLNPEQLRREILFALRYVAVPSSVTEQNILTSLDTEIQGRVDQNFYFDAKDQKNIDIIVYKTSQCKTIEGFGGLMRKYCSSWTGPIFLAIVQGLLDTNAPLKKEKLCALLSNSINDKPLFTRYGMVDLVYQPFPATLNKIRHAIGVNKLSSIENANIKEGKRVLHLYRLSNKPNRHGHCNDNPNDSLIYKFEGYNNPK
ncbi:hypothetical protein SAMD00019534_055340 [Acytostelium subglobosum LB1]|uniref:hypothetical protein n=1 Tax=Acytostelium subglobosum LB1 TaxID=1410327 RepID=UPI000644FC96|nr:hypothetical protein SAMD00019534_055340 [Acytostelium subglobosum LB1]GAM22359.1 hypothetical protein SAMD00019534_055340 [Acytostelium subglobosum LB1]|eukprot:XP_012754479.1 hypothetical protein SAMD00019534_055340 [Acytostelium subglobosum LB1]